ncbi:serine O-acetyltransferase EpsC [Aquitalea sp. LB_tupeE]|uniref:serine O-acetyltransferase EpsC n=1 Tax=Aquitalea sp. LB_tupeE TaxID=2748078 RepID=UPI0015C0202A|nr:serine O-acetyltransferase EpsC [Aquitalea sp. LB_tupeE]NWK80000.1 serine acetyltransferase [Aquitalea sp. LB_tupeE]
MNDLVRPLGPAQPVVHDWHLDSVVSALHAARADWRQSQGRLRDFSTREFPSRTVLRDVVATLAAALFPMRLGPPGLRDSSEDFFVGHSLAVALDALAAQVVLELRYSARLNGLAAEDSEAQSVAIVQQFAAALPDQRRLLDADITAAWQGDPAARSVDEVLLCYPGINAILHHRLAHLLYRADLPLVARIIAEIAHGETGIDIHPGAQIGAGFFIDHGTGVVIGETAVIGERVRLYQAVTLGAKRFEQGEDGSLLKGQPRHPIVEDDVVIYAGATVLGRITIGRGSSIGGNVWLTRSVPPGSQITQASLQG